MAEPVRKELRKLSSSLQSTGSLLGTVLHFGYNRTLTKIKNEAKGLAVGMSWQCKP